jgi:hypothetical protein
MSDQPLFTLDGVGNRLEMFPDRVIIRRMDTLARVLPTVFSSDDIASFDQIARVTLLEPDHLRLDECAGDCLQLVITRKDRHVLRLTMRPEQRQLAQEVRSAIQSRLIDQPATR